MYPFEITPRLDPAAFNRQEILAKPLILRMIAQLKDKLRHPVEEHPP